jgi:hypothetical protein
MVVLSSRCTGWPDVNSSAVMSTLKRTSPGSSAFTLIWNTASVFGCTVIGSKITFCPSRRNVLGP